ncbi:glycosyltransferase family 2 protein [Rubrivirga sp.]|uniref:glycosyltransferase family 2 protein n=1 Tax=Rubrivirga sp. TaxID=1885344 RepID=UPI003C746D13
MTETLRHVVLVLDVIGITLFALGAIAYTATAALAFPSLRKLQRWSGTFYSDEASGAAATPPITLIAPMYNEATVCVEAVRALLAVSYPMKEILVVNDGSKDETLDRLIDAFDMTPAVRPRTAWIGTAEVRGAYRSRQRPDLWIIDKENGGRSDAINVGINHCRTPLLCVLDGDSILAPDGLHRVVRPFLENASTVAVGGTIGIVNDCTVQHGRVTNVRMPESWVARFQVLEYIRAFASSRVGWNAIGALPLISGAFGLFKRQAVVAVNGLDPDTVGEDFELTLKLHRYHIDNGIPYHVDFVPDAVSWTECPSTLEVLGKQRDRWQRGGMEVVWKHRRVVFNPRYGRVGMFSVPTFLFIELMGPVMEALGYVLLVVSVIVGAFSGGVGLLLLALALSLGAAQSIAAIAFEQYAFHRYTSTRDLALLLAVVVLENLGYRQLTVWWRLRGIWKYIRKDDSWGEMTRTGFATSP